CGGCAGPKAAEELTSCDWTARRRREIDRNQHALELHVAADLIDETARPRCNEERRDRRAAEYSFRHRPMQPVRNAVAPMGREHDEVAPMLAQKVDDGLRRFLQFDAYVVDFDSELARDRPWRIILVGEPPLREQALCVRKRQ